ncbi:MAG TPA: PAS domain-containing protein [Candidatus Deferrimicrobiaceae bacterium]
MIRDWLQGTALRARESSIREGHRRIEAAEGSSETALASALCEALCAPGAYRSALWVERGAAGALRIAGAAGEGLDVLPDWIAQEAGPGKIGAAEAVVCAGTGGKVAAVPVAGAGEPGRALIVSIAGKASFDHDELADLASLASRTGHALTALRVADRFKALKAGYETQADALADERYFSRQILDLVPVPVIQLGSEGEIRRVNRRFEEVTGLKAADLLNRRMADLLLPEAHRSDFRRLVVELFLGRRPEDAVFPLHAKAGVPVRIAWDFALLRDDATGRVTSILAAGQVDKCV